MKTYTDNKNKKGFTIVELIMVMVVIGILCAVAIPNLSRVVRDATIAGDIRTCSNMNTKNSIAYAEHDDGLVAPTTVDEVVQNILVHDNNLEQFKAEAEGTAFYWIRSINTIVYVDKTKAADVNSDVYSSDWEVISPEYVTNLEQEEIDALFVTEVPTRGTLVANYFPLYEEAYHIVDENGAAGLRDLDMSAE